MPVVQVCLRAARVFCLVDGSLSAGFVWGSGFPVLLFILLGPDLSLSALLAPASRPWGFLVGACVCLGYFRSLDCPSPSHGGLPIGIPSFLSGYLPVALSHLPGGFQLFCFTGTPFQSVLLVCPGRWLLFLALSSAFCQVLDRCLLSSLWLGRCSASFPAALHPVSLSLACWLFPRFFCHSSQLCAFLVSGFLYFLAVYLVLGSSFPVLVLYSFLLRGTRGGIWILPSAPLGCFILLSLATGLLFLFLGTAFPTVQLVPRFSLLLF